MVELLDVAGPLTDPTAHGGRPEDAFDLVLSALPGYGFSGEPTEVGWDLGRTARGWAELMRRLGYTRYVAQGGDLGAIVTDAMGRLAPEGLAGIHTNLLVTTIGAPTSPPGDTEEERAALDAITTFRTGGYGYFLEQSTRPQTIGYALLDSPVALAAWMLDHDTDSYYKISRAFVDGETVGNLTRDHVVDNITLYWLTGTGASAARWYWELGQSSSTSGRPGASGGLAASRLYHVPGRDLSGAAQLGRLVVPERQLLQRGRQGRSLRRLGRARALLAGSPGRIQVSALMPPSPRLTGKPMPTQTNDLFLLEIPQEQLYEPCERIVPTGWPASRSLR